MSDSQTPSGPVLPEKSRSSKKGLWITLAIVAVVAIAAALILPRVLGGSSSTPETSGAGSESAGTGESAAPEQERVTVKLGTTDASQGHWPVLQEILAKEGIDLELVGFDNYETPNPALASGETDLNAFQHIDFLSSHNVATGDNLTIVGPTFIVPLPIYSTKYESVEEFPEGARVTIPNDTTNQGRALDVLQAAGLLELDPAAEIPTPADITSTKIEVVPVDATQTAPSLNDPQIAGAIVNNNFALDAGILDYALFSVDPNQPESWPYINVIAAREGDEENPTYLKVWEAYHDPAVTKILEEESGNTLVIVGDETPEQARTWLAEIEQTKKDAAK